MVIPSIAAIAAALGLVAVLLYRLHAFRQPADEIAEADGCTERQLDKAGARVKEAEAEANRYEMLYKLQNRDMALAERRAHDAEHRAARAERALMTVCTNVVKDEENDVAIEPCARVLYKAYLKQAEKELAEEEE